MVIDDDPDVRDLVELLLSSDYQVALCDSGPDGIAAVDGSVHAIVLDIHMDGKDGLWTHDVIRKRFSHVPIIFFSAGNNHENPCAVVNRYRPFGYIRKSSDMSELKVTVAKAVTHYAEYLRRESQLLVADRLAAVGTLAAGAAHEINNPLGFIMGNIEYVLDELRHIDSVTSHNDRDELERALASSLDGARRIATIVRDLKSFGQSETLAGENSADVEEALDLAIRMADNEIRHRARLIKDYGKIPHARANKQHLAQIFLNLLFNAAHALPIGNAEHHEIRVRTSADDFGHVLVEIRDSGTGIAPAIQDRIFDPFFTTKPPNEGTGLGLFVTHNLVESIGGTIQLVASSPQLGTIFHVTLPASRSPARKLEPAPARPGSAGSQRRRVLIIDDEPLIGRALCRMLAPHEVVGLSDGREAAALCQREYFDIILCDIMMPEFSGADVYRHLAASQPGVEARIVFMSGGVFESHIARFLDRLDNPVLGKPIHRETLLELIEGAAAAAPGAKTVSLCQSAVG